MFTIIFVTFMATTIMVSALYEPTISKLRAQVTDLESTRSFDDHVASTIGMVS